MVTSIEKQAIRQVHSARPLTYLEISIECIQRLNEEMEGEVTTDRGREFHKSMTRDEKKCCRIEVLHLVLNNFIE